MPYSTVPFTFQTDTSMLSSNQYARMNYVTLASTLALTFTLTTLLADSKTFHLGVLLPYTGYWPIGRTAAGAVGFALDVVNNDSSLTEVRRGGHRFNFTWKDTNCQEAHGLKVLIDLWAEQPIDAFIGKFSSISSSVGRENVFLPEVVQLLRATLRAQDWSRLRIQSLLYRSQGPLGKDYFRMTIFFPADFVTLLAVI